VAARGPVVVVPGLCVVDYLNPACHELAALGYDVLLLRPPGWPREEQPRPEPTTVADLARRLADVVRSEGLRDVLLIGQSAGAQLAAHVAVADPERVRLLLLQGPSFDPGYRTVPRALGRWLADLPRERPSLLKVEGPEWARVGPRRVVRTLRMVLADGIEQTLLPYAGEVAVVVGEHETLATPAWTMRLASRPELHVVLPGLPHSAANADPAGFARCVVELDRRAARAGRAS
jgi:pimeloyl-ACP methyl ester carboxylesterase